MRETTVSFEVVAGSGIVQGSHEIISPTAYVTSRVDLGDGTTGILWSTITNPSAANLSATVYQRWTSEGVAVSAPPPWLPQATAR